MVNSYRDITDDSISQFNCVLSQLNWDQICAGSDVNVCYNIFIDAYVSAYNVCFPMKIRRVKIRHHCPKPWITKSILKSIRRKNILYKKWLQKRSSESLKKYKIYRNKLTSVLRNAEKMYYAARFDDVKNNMSKTWSLIKSVMKPDVEKSASISQLQIDNVLVNDPKLIANKFNNYFINVGSSLSEKIIDPGGSYLDYVKTSHLNSMFMLPTDESEILDIVSNFNPNKSPGYDSISPKVIKASILCILKPLTSIFNLSLQEGIFPDRLKLAKVSPVFKCDDRSLVNNYRPISVLPVFSKILEKIVHTRLFGYLNKHNLLTDKQFGFREKHSTYMALINLVDKISTELDKNNSTVGIFIDLSKAFDTINHEILLNKLSYYGVRGNALKWFKSYLTDRSQFVQIKDAKSDVLNIKCGVPQGSILGPLLFIIYVNDIVNVSRIAHLIMFADDTNIFFSHSDPLALNLLINSELEKLAHWFKINKLSLNIKNHYIVFRFKNNLS